MQTSRGQIGEFWRQELLICWYQFLAEWYDSTAPKLGENFKLQQPTLTEFMSYLAANLPKQEVDTNE
jgi:hypothetical protein